MTKPSSRSPSGLRDTRYLQLIGSRWYARIPVPNKLRGEMGPYYRKALDTSDLREAQVRRWDVHAVAKAKFAKALNRGKPMGLSEAEMSYAAFRAKLREEVGPAIVVNAFDGEAMTNPDLDALVDRLEDAGVKSPAVWSAIGDHVHDRVPLSETLKDYLAANPKRSATTTKNYETTVKLWKESHGDKPLNGVTRKQAIEWLEAVAAGKARKTLKRYAGTMAQLWEWVHRKEEDLPRNPFDDLMKAVSTKGREGGSHGHYSDDELKRAYAAVAEDDELRPLFLISIYTGFRQDECLRAERETLHGVECFVLKSGKTDNAARVVPIHPRLKDVVAPKGVSANTISKRYGSLMRDIGMPKGKTFHSLRKAFTTALERANCPEAIAARLVGHAPLGITYRIYSLGREASELKQWVEKVRHPV